MQYADEFYVNRLIVLENYKCLCANGCEVDESLDVHHKDENKDNNDISNLIPLCRKCHIKAHGGNPQKDSYENRNKPFKIESSRKTVAFPVGIETQIKKYQEENGIPTFTGAMLELVRNGLQAKSS